MELSLSNNVLSLSGVCNNAQITNNISALLAKSLQQPDITVDLAAVDNIDSAGLALLLNYLRDAKHADVKVSFINIPDRLLSLAALSNADTLLK